MEIRALDKDFQLVSLLVPIVILWNRKYYDFGDFLIEVPYSQYSEEMKYIYSANRQEVGRIQKVSYKDTGLNKTIQISGYFLEKQLDDKAVYPTFYGNGITDNELKEMIDTYKDDINFDVDITNILGNRITFQETGEQLGTACRKILKEQQMSYKVDYNYQLNDFVLKFYRGYNRTQSQTENNFITFSTAWKNVQGVSAELDETDYKNVAIVLGEGESDERIVVEVDLSGGAYRREICIDAKHMRYDTSKQTLQEYQDSLYQHGVEKLMEYQNVHNIMFEPKGNSYEYLKDYDLGDKCDIIINDIGMSVEARIIAVYETFESGAHTIELEFGDKLFNKLEKVERKLQ